MKWFQGANQQNSNRDAMNTKKILILLVSSFGAFLSANDIRVDFAYKYGTSHYFFYHPLPESAYLFRQATKIETTIKPANITSVLKPLTEKPSDADYSVTLLFFILGYQHGFGYRLYPAEEKYFFESKEPKQITLLFDITDGFNEKIYSDLQKSVIPGLIQKITQTEASTLPAGAGSK